MAQQDTGLGWSAKDDWLYRLSGVICEASQSNLQGDFPCWPEDNISRPNVTSWLVPKGIYYMPSVSSHGVEYPLYTTTNANSLPPLGYFIAPVNGAYHMFIVASENFSIPYMSGWFRIWYLDNGYPNPVTQTTGGSTVQDPVTGLYYRDQDISARVQADTSAQSTIPFYASFADGMAAMAGARETFYKLNDGYAVAAVATWYSVNGETITAPVLISSVQENVVISTDNSTGDPRQQFSSYLIDGMRFYMTFIPGIEGTITGIMTQEPDLTQFGAALPSKVFGLLVNESFSNVMVLASPDPYSQEGGSSEADGGDGEDQDDDPVEEETLPVPSVAGHGFCTIYVPSSQELGQMASYLWSGAFDVDQVIKLMSNPMDSILGLSAVPVDLVGTSEQIYLGGVALTGITMPKYTGRTSIKVDFGTATIDKRWGSYLDYAPYTDFSIYLPFIGIKPIKADDIMGKTISLMYAIDILSGGCVAYLRPAGGSVLYEWSGQCALQIPVTGRSYDNVFQSAMSVATASLAAVTAPASAPVLSGAVASAAVQAAATKPHIERSGTVNGITGFLGQLRPYIIRTIPEAFIPDDQNKFIGYPAYINVDLASVTGYNEVDSIHLENVTATGAELDEIETILKGGVIF